MLLQAALLGALPVLAAAPAGREASPVVAAILEILEPQEKSSLGPRAGVQEAVQAVPPEKRAMARGALARVEPRVPPLFLSELTQAYSLLADPAGALRASETLQRRQPGFEADYHHALTLARLGQYEAAHAEAAALKERHPGRRELDALLASTRGRGGARVRPPAPPMAAETADGAVSAGGDFTAAVKDASPQALELLGRATRARADGRLEESWALMQAAMRADPKSQAVHAVFSAAAKDHEKHVETQEYLHLAKTALDAGRGSEATAWAARAAERSGSPTVYKIYELTKEKAARLETRPARKPAPQPSRVPLWPVGASLIAVGLGAAVILDKRRQEAQARELIEVAGPAGVVLLGAGIAAYAMFPPARLVVNPNGAATLIEAPALAKAAVSAYASKAAAEELYSYSKAPSSSGEQPSSRRSTDDGQGILEKPESFRGATAQDVEAAVPEGWVKEATKRGDGLRLHPNPPNGDQVRIMPGNPNDPTPVKRGPYLRVSHRGRTSGPIPLSGNPIQ